MSRTYGEWTVIKKSLIPHRVTCECQCGTVKDVLLKNLKSGISKNCGCRRREKLIKRNTKHNKRFTRTWRIWQAMKNRCYNKNVQQYHNYGGRGIKVHQPWKDSFECFLTDVGEAPIGKTIDRIDNDGDYKPGNVQWSTPKKQSQNKSNNRKINGVCISEISRSLGGSHSLVAKRIARGWDITRAVTEKVHERSKNN